MKSHVPLSFKQALIRGLTPTKDEIVLSLIYNGRCLSMNSIWNNLPRDEFESELNDQSSFKHNYIDKMLKEGALFRDKPDDSLKLRGGYSVNVEKAYAKKLPYTLMNLNPLPALFRSDYIYHLILYSDSAMPYKIFAEDKHKEIDRMYEESVYFAEKLMKEDVNGLFTPLINEFLNKYDINKDNDLNYALARRKALAEKYKDKMKNLPNVYSHFNTQVLS
jgi:hypothetical protein